MVSNNGFTLHITPEKSRGSSRHFDSLVGCSSLCVCHREVLGRSVIMSKAIEALTHSTEGCHLVNNEAMTTVNCHY